jgi:3-oxoacyl-[acyl-carrier protein] reductase
MEDRNCFSCNHKKSVALVSGATGGIGKAICRCLARTQFKVVMLARDVEKLKKAQEEIEGAEKFERPLEIQQIDISDPANVKSSVAAINSRFQQIELLVHAAGEGPVAPLLETDEALWQKSIQTKLLGTVRLTRAVAPTMVKNNQGSIIIINGAFSKEPHPLFPINSSINCGLAGFAKATAQDLGRAGIRVNVIDPGITVTPLWENTALKMADRLGTTEDDLNDMLKEKNPLGRFATPDDVADVVAFLASDKSYYLNGVSITVDGGVTAAI